MINVNFVPKNVQTILSSHKIPEKYNEQEVFYKSSCSQEFGNIHGKTHVSESLFNKVAGQAKFQNSGRRKKTCLFMMFFIISLFSISPLHIRWRLAYIIKMIVVKDFKTAQSMRY